MGIADDIGTRPCSDAVGHACSIAEICAVCDTEGRASLSNGNAGNLPAAENVVPESRSLIERQGVNIAERQVVPQIEIGTAAICRKVVSVHERVVVSVGGVVDGMAVGVGQAHRQVANGASHSGLHGIVDGVCLILKASEVAVAYVWTQRIGVIAACHAKSI